MDAGEPHLLQIGTHLLDPHGGFEVAALLVDGQRMAGDADIRSDLGIVKLILLVEEPQKRKRNTQRAHRIPHANEADLPACVRVPSAKFYRPLAVRVKSLA